MDDQDQVNERGPRQFELAGGLFRCDCRLVQYNSTSVQLQAIRHNAPLHRSQAHRQSSMSQENRAELLNNAVLFLLDPKVQSSPLTSRIQFLEGKGLNETEIQEALRRAQSGGQPTGQSSGGFSAETREVSGGYDAYPRNYGHQVQQAAPPVPGRDWRDVFVRSLVLL